MLGGRGFSDLDIPNISGLVIFAAFSIEPVSQQAEQHILGERRFLVNFSG